MKLASTSIPQGLQVTNGNSYGGAINSALKQASTYQSLRSWFKLASANPLLTPSGNNPMSWNELRKGRFSQKDQIYFITFATKDRIALFSDLQIAHLFCRQLMAQQKESSDLWLSWVLMPDHFHGLLQLKGSKLSTPIQRLKSKTAITINRHLGRSGQIWQHAYFDRALRKDENLIGVSRYIVANPLRGKLVDEIGQYPFWDSVYL